MQDKRATCRGDDPPSRHLRELEAENTKPERKYADFALEDAGIKGVPH
jgi:hypothetical protein